MSLQKRNLKKKLVGSVNYFSVNLLAQVSRAMNSCLGGTDARTYAVSVILETV
jgi:hypothetical protein